MDEGEPFADEVQSNDIERFIWDGIQELWKDIPREVDNSEKQFLELSILGNFPYQKKSCLVCGDWN